MLDSNEMAMSARKQEEEAEWLDTWNKNVSRIDDTLVQFYKKASEKTGDLAEQVRTKVQDMLDKTDMDERARIKWDLAKADSKLLGAQIENRIEHLKADGKITWAKITKKK